MKKNYLLILFTLFSGLLIAQNDYYNALVSSNATSGNARAPQGSRRYARSVYLITQAEMTASGLANGNVINSIAFNYLTAQDVQTSGSLIVYLQNTADATNTKSTTWSTAISGMTTVHNSTLTLNPVAGQVFIPFTGGSAFTYTGGAVYVAFDYNNPSGTIATVNSTVDCNSLLTNGLKGAQSNTAVQTTVAASSFRPATKLGKASTCSRPLNLVYNPTGTLNSNTVNWIIPDSGTNFVVEYGPYNFTPGTGTTLPATTNSLTISGLTDSTVYDYYVKKDCGGGVFSILSDPSSFSTQFVPVTPLYNTSFEQENLNFIGWSNPSATLVAGDWSIGKYGAGALVQNGVSSVVSVTPAAAAADNFMFSRGLNLTAGSTVTVSFYLSNYVNGTANTGSYQLTWGTSATAAAQTNVIGSETGVNTATFTLKSFNFVVPSTGVYYLGLRNQSPANAAGTHALIIDNLTVSEALAAATFSSNNFKVYPNPSTDIINIESDLIFENQKVSILDLNGRVVKSVNNKNSINISNLESGIYLLEIKTEKGIYKQKIVKE